MALRLAARALGTCAPNPAVGCVLVKEGQEVGRGWTQPGGRPHAETEALADARRRHGANASRGATAYVTLEPCAHYGQTPPCADALIEAGIARLVVACRDPDPRVNGGGIRRVREAGIEVELGVGEVDARDQNAGFFTKVELGRPHVTLKTATSLDGRIATAAGQSKWITGPRARARGHLLRATHDAVLVGIGTALADDPKLNCRLPRFATRSPIRIVADTSLRLPPTSQLAVTARQQPTWVLTQKAAARSKPAEALTAAGVEIIPVEGAGTELDLAAALKLLASRGVTRLLVEGGGRLAAGLVRRDLVDTIVWFRAPILLGGDARPAFAELGLSEVAAAPRFKRVDQRRFGDDLMETLTRITA